MLPATPIRTKILTLLSLLALLIAVMSSLAIAQNRVLELDGHGDYVQLPSGIFSDLDEATVECWVKWNVFQYLSQPFGFGKPWHTIALNNGIYTNELQFFVYDGSGSLHVIGLPNVLQPNRWYHVAAVTGSGGMKLYLDGELVGENAYTGSFSTIPSSPNYLGRSPWLINADFKGQLDEVRIWRDSRTQEQIQDWMNRRLTGDEPDLVALWNFDDGSAHDASRNAFDGVMMGDAQCVEGEPTAPQQSTSVIFGVVRDLAGSPLSNVRVVLRQPGWAIRTVSDATGRYEIPIYSPQGRYDLSVAQGRFASKLETIEPRPSQQLAVPLALYPLAQLRGRVEALNDTPLANVVVEVLRQRRQGDPTLEPIDRAWTNENGKYQFASLLPDRYWVRCTTTHGYVYYQPDRANMGGMMASQPNASRLEGDMDKAVLRMQPGQVLDDIDFRILPFRKGSWRSYAAESGLLPGSITTIYQSADGVLWFGTESGVSCFNGGEFTNFTTQEGLAGNSVTAIHQDTSGAMWFGTDSGLSRYEDAQFISLTRADGLPSDSILDLLGDEMDGLWIATSAGICYYTGGRVIRVRIIIESEPVPVTGIERDRDGILWLGGNGYVFQCPQLTHRLKRLLETQSQPLESDPLITLDFPHRDQLINLSSRNGLGEARFARTMRSPSADLWLLTNTKTVRYDGSGFTRDESLSRIGLVNQIHISSEGMRWLATDRGVFRLDGNTIVRYTDLDGMLSSSCRSIYCDTSGRVWIGTDTGLSLYDPSTVTNFTVSDGLSPGPVRSIRSMKDSTLWLSTGSGHLLRYDGVAFTALNVQGEWGNLRSAANFGDPWGLYQRKDGSIWFGGGSLIWRYQPEVAAKERLVRSEMGAPVRCVTEALDGTLWIGTYNGVTRYDHGRMTNITTDTGLKVGKVYAIHHNATGTIWLGGEHGIARYNGTGSPDRDMFTHFTTKDGLVNNWVNTIYQSYDGLLWLGTRGGISRYDETSYADRPVFTNFTRRDGLPAEQIWDIHQSADGVMWFGTFDGGICGFDGIAWTYIDAADGLGSQQIWAITGDAEDSFWLGTDKGLTHYQRSSERPKVRIEDVETDRRMTDFSYPLRTIVGKAVTISYSAVDFKTLPHRRQYRHRLVVSGKSEPSVQFGKPTSQMTFKWTPNRAGNYTFEVVAIDRDLRYSEPARLELTVVQPWYFDWWLVIPSGGGILVLVVLTTGSGIRYSRCSSFRLCSFEQHVPHSVSQPRRGL